MSGFPVELIQATVQVDQPLSGGERTVGTGFLVSATAADGAPRTVLITAKHVLAGMPGQEARIGFRTATTDGGWTYTPRPLTIRDEAGEPLWTAHPGRDVAAIAVQVPPEFVKAAIPASYLAADDTYAERNITPGAELMVLGFPRGLAANNAGFPILRSGRVASYPVSPKAFPTFLLDFSVFPGNSGGPVFVSIPGRTRAASQPFIAGLLTQQVQMNDERLEIGVVTHSKYIVETLALMEDVRAPLAVARHEEAVPGAEPASQTPEPPSLWARVVQGSVSWVETAFWSPMRRLSVKLATWLAPNRALAQAEGEPGPARAS